MPDTNPSQTRPDTGADGGGETQLYLVTPVAAQPGSFGPMLEEILDALPVACIRIPGAGDEAMLGQMADMVREIAHRRDIAVVIEDHVQLARNHGLDGVHLTRGDAAAVRAARKTLGADAIVGAQCGVQRHDGINAAEAGADYVSFGPVGTTGLGAGDTAPRELFEWWSEMIEVPVVAEGGLSAEQIAALDPLTDFFAIGPEIWTAEDPRQALIDMWRHRGS